MKKHYMAMQHRGRQAGVTLMELIAALAIMAVIVAGAVALYTSASSSEKATSISRDLASIQSSVRALYSGQGSYGTGSLNAVLADSKKLPTTIKVSGTGAGTTLTHVANGTIAVTGSSATFTVAVNGLKSDLCTAIVTSATNWTSVAINGGTAITSFPVTPATATAQCNAASNSIVFTN